MNFSVDLDSVKAICGDSKEAMIYGREDVGYVQVAENLGQENSPIKKVYLYTIGDPDLTSLAKTLHDKQIDQIQIDKSKDETKHLSRICKAGLVNLTFENYKRKKEGLPLIQLLFITDIENSPVPFDSLGIASKEPEKNKLITNKELRRLYKIIKEFENEPELKELSDVAKESFHFIKLMKKQNSDEYRLEESTPFWKTEGWDQAWDKRLVHSQLQSKQFSWKEQIKQQIVTYNNNSPSFLVTFFKRLMY